MVISETIGRLKLNKFKQQTLDAWRPMPTPFKTAACFASLAALFLIVGGILMSASNSVFVSEVRYDNLKECLDVLDKWKAGDKERQTCSVALNNGEKFSTVQGPVYVYYELGDFYQNHRRYVKSRDAKQLFGQYRPEADLINCDPVKLNK